MCVCHDARCLRSIPVSPFGWMNQRHVEMIEYLREENKVLREQLGRRRLRLNDDQRRRLAAKAKGLGRKLLSEIATIVTPEALEESLVCRKILICPRLALGNDAPKKYPHLPQATVGLKLALAGSGEFQARALATGRFILEAIAARGIPKLSLECTIERRL